MIRTLILLILLCLFSCTSIQIPQNSVINSIDYEHSIFRIIKNGDKTIGTAFAYSYKNNLFIISAAHTIDFTNKPINKLFLKNQSLSFRIADTSIVDSIHDIALIQIDSREFFDRTLSEKKLAFNELSNQFNNLFSQNKILTDRLSEINKFEFPTKFNNISDQVNRLREKLDSKRIQKQKAEYELKKLNKLSISIKKNTKEGIRFAYKSIVPINGDYLTRKVYSRIYSINYSSFPPNIKDVAIPSDGYFIQQNFNDKMFYVYLTPINNGASGAPVLSQSTNKLVGFISRKYISTNNINTGFAYVTSTKTLDIALDSFLNDAK